MSTRSLQEAIDGAGSPVALLWRVAPAPWAPPVIEPEYAGWEREQRASGDAVALSDLSHHMADLTLEGPDALKLLMERTANKFASFAVGQAKQIMTVDESGHLIADGILMRLADDRFMITCAPAPQHWIQYHGERQGYRVRFSTDPDSAHRDGADPVLYRFQVQGPHAVALTEKVFGAPAPETRFFHSTTLRFGDRPVRAFRHGMTGQPGFEFIGPFAEGAALKDVLMTAGEEFGIVHVGARAYSTNGIESGWIPTGTPAIYSAPEQRGFREWLPADSYEGHKPLSGSFYSPDIEDYYATPWELGYGRSIDTERDYPGRDALVRAREERHRSKVTLVLDPKVGRAALGDGFAVTYGRYRVLRDGADVGVTAHIGSIASAAGPLGLALVEDGSAQPWTAVTIVYGDDPGATGGPAGRFTEIPATVAPSPYNEFARTRYRSDAPLVLTTEGNHR